MTSYEGAEVHFWRKGCVKKRNAYSDIVLNASDNQQNSN